MPRLPGFNMRRAIATPSVAASNNPLLITSRSQPGTPLLAVTLRVTARRLGVGERLRGNPVAAHHR